MAPGDRVGDVTLTALERRRWTQLRRRLEADETRSAGHRRAVRAVAAGTILLLFLAGAVFGGLLGAVAVACYVLLNGLVWGVHRVVWRRAPATGRPRDLI